MGRVAKFKDQSSNKQKKQIILLILLAVGGGIYSIREFSGGGPVQAIASDSPANQVKNDATQKNDNRVQPLAILTINDHLNLAGDPFDIDETQYQQTTVPDVVIVEPDVKVNLPAKIIDPKEIQKTFRVQAIFGRDVSRALINDKVYVEGDKLREGVFVERIEQRLVTLKAGNHRINIKLDKE